MADHSFLSEDDLRVATYKDSMIILPVQRVQMAFGARTSWLQDVHEPFPKTWDDAKRTAGQFEAGNPAGTGKGTVFGFALEAANPRDLIHILDLFTFGAGVRHTLLAPDGTITIDEPQHATILEQFLKIFTVDKLVPPDTINYSFNENVSTDRGRPGRHVPRRRLERREMDDVWHQGGFRRRPLAAILPRSAERRRHRWACAAWQVPVNSPHKDLATALAAFLLDKPAQQASLKLVGSAVRKDLDTAGLTPQAQKFASPAWPLIAYDFPESIHPWYPQLEAAFHRKLLGAIANPPADYGAFIKQTAVEMRQTATTLAQQK